MAASCALAHLVLNQVPHEDSFKSLFLLHDNKLQRSRFDYMTRMSMRFQRDNSTDWHTGVAHLHFLVTIENEHVNNAADTRRELLASCRQSVLCNGYGPAVSKLR